MKQSRSQRIGGFLFDKLPQDYQLYPRNHQNNGLISIAGTSDSNQWTNISIVVNRNKDRYSYSKIKLNFQQGLGFFNTQISIKAELAEYEIQIYAIQQQDSILIVNRKNIVAGDVFLVSGQSNSYNGKENKKVYKGEFARSFGKYANYTNTVPYNPSDTLWSISNSPADVGLWASQIQKHIIEEQKIPVCIINGGSGGSSMEYNLARGVEKADLSQSSGRLYYKVMKAGLLNAAKAFIYRQGENDSNGNALGWLENFKKHVDLLKKEYPSIQKIYLPQINVVDGNYAMQGYLRNDQRKILQENHFIQGFATVGTQGYDGIHYTPEGYFQSAWEMYRLLDRDFYSKKINAAYESPNLKRAYFGSADKKLIVLEFDDKQEMVVQQDTTLMTKQGQNLLRSIQENFYLTGISLPQLKFQEIQAVKAYGNKVVIRLEKAPLEEVISYLPSYFPKDNFNQFSGPYLKNKGGMRAFSFENIRIEPIELFDTLASVHTFYTIPQDYQLFPRNKKTNLGEITLAGNERSGHYKAISAILKTINGIQSYQRLNLVYQNNRAEWTLKLPIKAEKVNHTLEIFVHKSSIDSVKIASRGHLVAGDIILVNGGINASASFNESETDEFSRTFGRNSIQHNGEEYALSDTIWSVANSAGYANNVGPLAYSLQKNLSESLQIPIALLNLSDHHSTTEGLLKSAMDPLSLRTNYGKMLYRIEKAGLKNQVKAYIFRHGEIDSDKIAQSTIASVNQLIQDLKDDFPGLEKIVLCQNDIGDHPSENGAILREFQRTITRKFPMVIPFSTLGTKGFTGSIYSKEGYQSNGREIAQLLLLQVYQLGNSDVENGAPNLKKVYQSRANPEKLTLEFEKGQNIQFPGTFTHPSGKKLEINEFINVDNFAFQIKKATVNGHKIELDLVSNTPKNTISYLPSFVSSNYYFFPYLGPYIQNSKGKNAFSFYQVKIQKALSAPKILEKQKKWDLISIQWENLPQASSYQLLRKKSGETNFQVMGQFTPSTNSFSEIPAKLNTSYEYQLIAQNDSTESDPAMITISVPDSLNSIPLSLVKQEKLSIPLIWPKVADASKYVLSRQGPGEPFKTIYQGNEIQFEDKEITAGISYVYKMQYFTETGISQTSYLKAKTELTLGTENEAKNGIRIFPNPSKNQMTLEFGEHISGQVFLVNMNGMHLKQWGIFHQNSLEISLADYPEGSYFIQIQNEQWPSDLIYKVVRIP
ncbi:sialate O-acetylesterase [Aquirufa sp. OSTEICH-129A]